MTQKSDCAKNLNVDKKSTSQKGTDKSIRARFSIVSHFGRIAADWILIMALVAGSSYCALKQADCRAPYVQMSGLIVTALLSSKGKK